MPVRGGGVAVGPTSQVLRPARQVTVEARQGPTRGTPGCSWPNTATVCVLSPRRNFAAATRIDGHKMKAKNSRLLIRERTTSSKKLTTRLRKQHHWNLISYRRLVPARVVVFWSQQQLFAASSCRGLSIGRLSWFDRMLID